MASKIITSPRGSLAGGSLMILAAGFGTRLRPLTGKMPKALVPVGGRPLMRLCLDYFRSFRPGLLLVNGHHYADQLAAFLNAEVVGYRRFRFLREPEILDTGGALRNAAPLVEGDFLVTVNVDVVSDISPLTALTGHLRRRALITMVLHDHPRYNQVEVDADGRIVAFGRSRPRPGNRLLAYTGIQVCSPTLLCLLRRRRRPAFPLIPFYQQLLDSGRRDLLAQVVDTRRGFYWRDVGTLRDLAACEADFAARPGLSAAVF